MDCVNHPGVSSAAYCQNCGKAMCATCMRREPTGQVLCEPCWMAWHSARAQYAGPYAPPANPVLAGILGFIPGVGAMYNGQFVKGFLHVVIFAVLVSFSHIYGLFGLFVAAWIFYQAFEAFQTAKARRDGMPMPDPLGMNELVSWFGHEFRRSQGMPPAPGAGPVPPPAAGYAPPAAGYQPPAAGPAQAQPPNPYPPYTQYGAGYGAAYPYSPSSSYQPPAGFSPAVPPVPGVPPVPPVPPVHWRRREPVAAIILIAMGVLFLMGRMSWHVMQFGWPVLLIGLGVWLVVRRMRDTPPMPPAPPPGAGPYAPGQYAPSQQAPSEPPSNDDLQGGSR